MVAITWKVTREHTATLCVRVDGECTRDATVGDLEAAMGAAGLESHLGRAEKAENMLSRIENLMADQLEEWGDDDEEDLHDAIERVIAALQARDAAANIDIAAIARERDELRAEVERQTKRAEALKAECERLEIVEDRMRPVVLPDLPDFSEDGAPERVWVVMSNGYVMGASPHEHEKNVEYIRADVADEWRTERYHNAEVERLREELKRLLEEMDAGKAELRRMRRDRDNEIQQACETIMERLAGVIIERDHYHEELSKMREERDAELREVLEDCGFALENFDNECYSEGAANIDDAVEALRAALGERGGE